MKGARHTDLNRCKVIAISPAIFVLGVLTGMSDWSLDDIKCYFLHDHPSALIRESELHKMLSGFMKLSDITFMPLFEINQAIYSAAN